MYVNIMVIANKTFWWIKPAPGLAPPKSFIPVGNHRFIYFFFTLPPDVTAPVKLLIPKGGKAPNKIFPRISRKPQPIGIE